jgi:hypothetical protein
MLCLLRSILATLRSTLSTRVDLALENLALRQQLAVLRQQVKRPRVRFVDRLFWVWLRQLWDRWREALVLVEPETVIRWHREGFRRFWARKSRRRGPGRPGIDVKVKDLIEKIATANPLWGAPRVHGELLELGITISQRTVSRLMPPRETRPSPTWRSFLENHSKELVSVDFFTVPTATFRVLFGLIILSHDRRRVVHFNVTANPTAQWAAQQVVNAFPWDTAPRFLLRDRDSIFGGVFCGRVRDMGIEEVLIAYRSPWQSPYVERLIGSIRRECLDHVIVLGERHLRRLLKDYVSYYHGTRTHLSLEKDCPEPRSVSGPEMGEVVELPEVGGLHHRYERAA